MALIKFLTSISLAAVLTVAVCAGSLVRSAAGDELVVEPPALRSFAKAYLAVEQIRQSYLLKLGDTDDLEQSRSVEAEAQAKIREAITSEGLTPEKYREIVKTANGNDGLRVQVIHMIDQQRKQPMK